jgi:hypothetical protein
MKKHIYFILFMFLISLNMNGQSLNKRLSLENITFLVPETWITYNTQGMYNIMAPDGTSLMMITIDQKNFTLHAPSRVKNINNENTEFFETNGLSWKFYSYTRVGTVNYSEGSVPVKGFEASTPMPGEKHIYVSAMSFSKDKSYYIKTFENILKSIKRR